MPARRRTRASARARREARWSVSLTCLPLSNSPDERWNCPERRDPNPAPATKSRGRHFFTGSPLLLRVRPGIAHASLHGERGIERVRADHLVAHEVADGARLHLRDLEEE